MERRTQDSGLFSGDKHSEAYATYRPVYPQELYSAIWKFCSAKSDFSFDLAVDVGCGSGQSSLGLIPKFERVIGMDVSESMIKQAKARKHKDSIENIEFQVGSAEDLSSFEASSIDLVTFAACFHWLNTEVVYEEVRRVLKPGGVIAVYTGGNLWLSSEEASRLVKEFFFGTLEKYWSPRRQIVTREYRDFIFPFEDFTRDHSMRNIRQMPLSSFIGYLQTWSSYQPFITANPDSKALEELEVAIREVYQKETGSDEEDMTIEVIWPVFLLMGRK